MKRPISNATRASDAVHEAAASRPVRSSRAEKIRPARAARVAGGDLRTATAGRGYKQTRGAAVIFCNSITQRPLLALLVTGAIGFMIGLLHPRH